MDGVALVLGVWHCSGVRQSEHCAPTYTPITAGIDTCPMANHTVNTAELCDNGNACTTTAR